MEENFFKLLEYEQKLEKTGEYLSLEKEKELLNYQSQISDHFRWKKKTILSKPWSISWKIRSILINI